MRIWKRRLAAAFLLCIMVLCVLPAQAKDGGQPGAAKQDEGGALAGDNMQLTDQAGLLTEQEAEEINRRLVQLEENTGWDFMALTTDDAGGKDATAYAETWFDKYTTKDDGIICAIDMDNREIVVRAFGEAMYYITDRRTEEILDAGYEEVSEEEYAATLQAMLGEVEEAYREEDASKNHLYDEDTGEITRYPKKKSITLSEILIALGLAVFAGGATVCGIFGKYRLKFGGYQYPIEKNGSVKLARREDRLVNSFVTKRHIPKPQDSGGDGSRSTTHTGAGGRSSSGGSRGF